MGKLCNLSEVSENTFSEIEGGDYFGRKVKIERGHYSQKLRLLNDFEAKTLNSEKN